MQPKAPKAAAQSSSGPTEEGFCAKETNKADINGLAMCAEMNNDSQNSFGNGFPWENSTFFFATYRNQFLYPSTTLDAMGSVTCDIQSIGARVSSFSTAGTNTYASFANGAPSTIAVTDAIADSLVSTFSLNTGGTSLGLLEGTAGSPIVFEGRTGVNGSTVSTCTSCPGMNQVEQDSWAFNISGAPINIEDRSTGPANVLVDTTLAVGTGNSGAGVWDVTSAAFGQGCAEPVRAFGSGSFANPNHLTTALGVDQAAFVWVFQGTAPPPPMNLAQQVSEIVRLLLTPEGLRCSSLDTEGGNGRVQDEPVQFPAGAEYDTISQQVSSGGTITGDELGDGLRGAGFQAP
jgi:hypothetical protein